VSAGHFSEGIFGACFEDVYLYSLPFSLAPFAHSERLHSYRQARMNSRNLTNIATLFTIVNHRLRHLMDDGQGPIELSDWGRNL